MSVSWHITNSNGVEGDCSKPEIAKSLGNRSSFITFLLLHLSCMFANLCRTPVSYSNIVNLTHYLHYNKQTPIVLCVCV